MRDTITAGAVQWRCFGTSGSGALAPAAAAKPSAATEEEDHRDPVERVREIRTEEDRLRRARSQFLESNPRMVATIDRELETLSLEREKLQPLEVNLQAVAGRTAHARGAVAKAKEKKALAAKELRTHIESFKAAEKEVAEAESRLSAAEAAATAKRTEVKATGVMEAVELLQQATASKCGDSAIAAQVAAALQQIASVLGAVTAPTTASAAADADGAASTGQTTCSGKGDGDGAGGGQHPVFAVCGSTDAKKFRTMPLPQEPAALAGGAADVGGHEQPGTGGGAELFAGGAVDGEVSMGAVRPAPAAEDNDEGLLSQAAAVLGDEEY